MSDGVSTKGLIARLRLPAAMARRLAIRDLIQRIDAEPSVVEALIEHLDREDDPRALIMIARELGERRVNAAVDALAALRDHPDSAVEVAHAARIAFDQIEHANASSDDETT